MERADLLVAPANRSDGLIDGLFMRGPLTVRNQSFIYSGGMKNGWLLTDEIKQDECQSFSARLFPDIPGI